MVRPSNAGPLSTAAVPLARYETTTWYLADRVIEDLLARSDLRITQRYSDLAGAPYDPQADFQTLTITHR
jgi:hypothetical protein